jgi:phosphoglycerate dehydrogenase-like enzyme
VARRAKGFGVGLIAFDPVWPAEAAEEIGIRQVDRDTLIAESDIISLTLPLTPETEGLINERRLAEMKAGIWIVNTSRGKVVDEKAMYDALILGHVAGYATDVFDNEPPVGSPLLALPNVIATPHIGTYTTESLQLMGERCADAVLKVRRGERPECVVNPEVYQQKDMTRFVKPSPPS